MSDETPFGHIHELCDKDSESRQALVEISATVDGHEQKFSAPLWMFLAFSGMARDFNDQRVTVKSGGNSMTFREWVQSLNPDKPIA
jgi:hypothetical protein